MTGEHARRPARGGAAGIRGAAEIAVLAISVGLMVVGWRRGQPLAAMGLAVAVAVVLSLMVRARAAGRRVTGPAPGRDRTGRPPAVPSADAAAFQRERARTAGELNDVLGLLNVISMYASTLELDPARTGRDDDEVRAIRRTTSTAMEELRSIADGLSGTSPTGGAATAAVPGGRRRTARAGAALTGAALTAAPLVVVLLIAGAWFAVDGGRPAGSAGVPAPVAVSSPAPAGVGAAPSPTGPPEVDVVARLARDAVVDASDCYHQLDFEAVIQVSHGPVTVRYLWTRSDSVVAPQEIADFPGTGPQRKVVRTEWALGAEGAHWQAVQVLTPVATVSNQANVTIEC